jgi:fatty-acyl-CoA synthase
MGCDPRSGTVDALLRRSARRHPERTAIRFSQRCWTYRDLDDVVTRAAAVLQGYGMKQGDRVAVFGANSDYYVVAFLAVLRAGLIHVPINNALRGQELRYLLEDCGAAAVLVDPGLAGAVSDVLDSMGAAESRTGTDPLAVPMLTLGDGSDSLIDQAQRSTADLQPMPVEDSGVAQILYTSGTTSRPKGAMMSHRALTYEYISSIMALDQSSDDNPLICMPLYHSAALHVHMMPYLSIGATIRLLEKPAIPEIMRYVAAESIRTIFLAPTVWTQIAEAQLDPEGLATLRKASYGASVMPAATLRKLQRQHPKLGFWNGFGQSEIGPLAAVLRPEEHHQRPGSCGRTVLFTEARVVDTSGADVPDGEVGELVYRSPQLCLGYWNNPEATAEAFRDNWFHSGDLVTRDAEGYLTFVDRIKDVINTGGVLVSSREVEDALCEHPAVSYAAVIATPDPKWIEAVTAAVVLAPHSPPATEMDLIAFVKERLASFKAPKRIHFLTELPVNPSGKVLKRELREQLCSPLGRM